MLCIGMPLRELKYSNVSAIAAKGIADKAKIMNCLAVEVFMLEELIVLTIRLGLDRRCAAEVQRRGKSLPLIVAKGQLFKVGLSKDRGDETNVVRGFVKCKDWER
jgi:hypothetical protein